MQVPRDANTDADLLSHPEEYERVAAGARAAGLTVHRAHISLECWETLIEAAELRCGVEGDELQKA